MPENIKQDVREIGMLTNSLKKLIQKKPVRYLSLSEQKERTKHWPKVDGSNAVVGSKQTTTFASHYPTGVILNF